MEFYIFARRDKKLGAFQPPYYEKEDVEHVKVGVVRGLQFVKSEERARAADFALYYLGKFDDESGKFILLEREEKLLDFEDYLPKKEGESYGEAA